MGRKTRVPRALPSQGRAHLGAKLTATNWLFSNLMMSPTRTFIHCSCRRLQRDSGAASHGSQQHRFPVPLRRGLHPARVPCPLPGGPVPVTLTLH